MDPVEESVDEEQVEKVVSFRGEDDQQGIEMMDNNGSNGNGVSASNSLQVSSGHSYDDDNNNSNNDDESGRGGAFSNFLDRFRRSDIGGDGSSERSSSSGTGTHGKWRTLPGSRRIRFASTRSDDMDHNVRGIVATPLDSGQCKPMAPGERFLKNIQAEVGDVADAAPNFLRKSSTMYGDEEKGGDASQEGQEKHQMYRLQATRGTRDVGCFRRTLRFLNACINCGALTESSTEQDLYLGFGNPNRWLTDFFFWLFRKGWSAVVVLSVLWYYAFVVLFAFMIVVASNIDDDCVRVGGEKIGALDNRSKFMDAFSLSWNTFSTVGYGSTYPALSLESDGNGDGRCTFISFLTSLEAFVGVIYAGFVGAIFFAKVARITQRANVQFSDPLTIRFGTGVNESEVDDDEDKAQGESSKKSKKPLTAMEKFRKIAKKVATPSPFPVITFRIANEQHGILGGEIISASINAVVLIESDKYDDKVSEDLEKQINMDRMRRASKEKNAATLRKTARKKVSESTRKFSAGDSERTPSGRLSLTERTDKTAASSEDDNLSTTSSEMRKTENAVSYLHTLNSLAFKGKKKMKIDEEETGTGSKIVPRMVFTKLKLETSEHPLFKRIWRFKHIIDVDSPLLTPEAQRAILQNNGKWPWEWNNHKAVRKAIRFNQMVVSFTGISNISGASVYKQKVYDYVDTVVGYQFVDALYRGRRGQLKVDLQLINDVKEQNGGGGEPLNISGKEPERESKKDAQSP